MVSRIMFILMINSFLCTAYEYNDDKLQEIELYNYMEIKEYEIFLNNALLIHLKDFKYYYPNMNLHSCTQGSLHNLYGSYYNEADLIVEIPKVTADMNGYWQCYIGKNYMYYFHFKILVKDPNALQMVVVNHLVLATRQLNEYYMAEYYYYKGDEMDVYCISRTDTCTVQMSYGDTQNEIRHASSKYLRVNLQSRYYANDIVCKCSCLYNSETKVIIRFILKTARDLKMSINGIKVAEMDLRQQNLYGTMDCAYFMNENDLNVSYTIPNQEIDLYNSNVNPIVTNKLLNNELLLNVNPRALTKLDVTIYIRKYNNYYFDYDFLRLEITFIPLNLSEVTSINSSPATTVPSTTKESTTTIPPRIETRISYPTESSTTILHRIETRISYPTVPQSANPPVTGLPSTKEHINVENTTFKIVAHNHDKQGIIITIITITVICLICISTYVYKKIYKRSRPVPVASTDTVRFMKGPGESGNLQYNSNRKIPIHPSEREHNGTVLIVDKINDIYDNVDRLYSNEYTKSQKDESENIYANNYERDQGNNSDEETQSGLIYADLNLSECLYANQISSKEIPSGFNVNSDKDMYAQIQFTNVRHK